MTVTIWMMVTSDKFELPVAVADSAGELARMVSCTENNIYSSYSHYKRGVHKRSRFIKVEFEEDENDQLRINGDNG